MLQEELLKQIRLIDLKVRRQVESSLQGSYHTLFKGHGLEFQEVREYVEGEDVRLMDWNVTARMGRPFVRVYREERELTVMVVVDVSASTLFGRAWSGREVAATLGAALAFSAIRNNDKAGLILFSDRIEGYIPPRRGRNHLLTIIRALLTTPAKGRRTDPDIPFRFINKAMKKKSLLFFLSDMQFGPLPDSAAVAARRHEIVPVAIFDRMSYAPERNAFVRTRDPESGMARVLDLSVSAEGRWDHVRKEKEDAFKRIGSLPIWIENQAEFINDLVLGFKKMQRKGAR
ncbi:MAG TPA: DUF58 domain-containing protein [bacterium]|nr:DUF58 domain-containing protein [bacterium]